jgi:hypothetical protein
MAKKLFANDQFADPYADRPIPPLRPISPSGTPPFPTKPFNADDIPYVPVKAEPLVISITAIDKMLFYLHESFTYTRWAVFLIRLTVKTIHIIQSVFPPQQETV